MILIADSGSTKTSWALIEEGTEFIHDTGGFNPYYMDPSVLGEILSKELPSRITDADITSIFYYGSGCSTTKHCGLVETALRVYFPAANIEVRHDLLAAARAILGHNKGIACILGTGANSCAYDGKQITKNVASLGYIFGDEGSGAYIGQKFLAAYLKGKLSRETNEAFESAYHYSLEDILSAVYGTGSPSSYMASFTHFMAEHEHHDDIREILLSSFIDFFQESVSKYTGYKQLPVSFVGSIAFHFRHILNEAAGQEGITVGRVDKAPMEGLIRYHREQTS
ncbi:MAG: hypothetical protein ABFS05_02330 [Bacteroidota bacterium]